MSYFNKKFNNTFRSVRNSNIKFMTHLPKLYIYYSIIAILMINRT